MSTKIEWTDTVWNPTTGCNKVSPGCKNCYAEIMHKRMQGMGQPKYQGNFLDGAVPQPTALRIPFTWKKPRKVFVNSMSDLFHEDVPFLFIYDVWKVMSDTPQHTYQILTKRPERMAEFLNTYMQMKEPLPNVWLGTSIEDQKRADEHIPHLLQCPASARFLSCEPLLGPVDIAHILMYGEWALNKNVKNTQRIHWVICGGESGHGARPMHPDWARSLRDQCAAANVPFFFKQWGEFAPLKSTSNEWAEYRGDGDKYLTQKNGVVDVAWFGEKFTEGSTLVFRVGKKYAIRSLDGKEHNEFPPC